MKQWHISSRMQDNKHYNEMPGELCSGLASLGYRLVRPEDQALFDPFYDRMNGTWTSSSCFPNFPGWMESEVIYMKQAGDFMIVLAYLKMDDSLVLGPFLGKHTAEDINRLISLVKKDFDVLERKLTFMYITGWMLPFYDSGLIDFTKENHRDHMEYLFTPEEFKAGMDASDDRYRYRYFKRKYDYEVFDITPEYRKEIYEFMDYRWCLNTGCGVCAFGCLKKVIDNIVKNFDILRVNGILVRVNGSTAGFCIVSHRNGLGVYQYKNTINKYKGINEYLLRECFERFLSDVKVINYTEDLGNENLRYYKSHMAPSFSLGDSYVLTEK